MIKPIVPVKLEDYKRVRKSLRELMKATKRCDRYSIKYSNIRYLKEIKMEIDSFLHAHGMIRTKTR